MPPGFGPLEDLLPQGACVYLASTRATRFLRILDSNRNLPEANAKVLPHEAYVLFDVYVPPGMRSPGFHSFECTATRGLRTLHSAHATWSAYIWFSTS